MDADSLRAYARGLAIVCVVGHTAASVMTTLDSEVALVDNLGVVGPAGGPTGFRLVMAAFILMVTAGVMAFGHGCRERFSKFFARVAPSDGRVERSDG